MTKLRVIVALPSSGKSHIVFQAPDRFVDSDDLQRIFGFHNSYEGSKAVKDILVPRFDEFIALIGKRTILTNMHPAWALGMDLAEFASSQFASRFDIQMYGYHPREYVRHIKLSGRVDLLENFGEERLIEWAEDYARNRNVKWMRSDEYLSDALGI